MRNVCVVVLLAVLPYALCRPQFDSLGGAPGGGLGATPPGGAGGAPTPGGAGGATPPSGAGGATPPSGAGGAPSGAPGGAGGATPPSGAGGAPSGAPGAGGASGAPSGAPGGFGGATPSGAGGAGGSTPSGFGGGPGGFGDFGGAGSSGAPGGFGSFGGAGSSGAPGGGFGGFGGSTPSGNANGGATPAPGAQGNSVTGSSSSGTGSGAPTGPFYSACKPDPNGAAGTFICRFTSNLADLEKESAPVQGGKGAEQTNNPSGGGVQVNVACIKAAAVVGTTPGMSLLKDATNKAVTITGTWSDCKAADGNTITLLTVDSKIYSDVLTQCKAKGFETAQPLDQQHQNFNAFSADKQITEHYHHNPKNGLYQKEPQGPAEKC